MGESRDRYVAFILRMVDVLRAAVARGERPTFRFPSDDVMFIAPLDDVAHTVCVDDAARRLVAPLVEAADGGATCFMLQVALKRAGLEYKTASFAELGLTVDLS